MLPYDAYFKGYPTKHSYIFIIFLFCGNVFNQQLETNYHINLKDADQLYM